MNKNDVIEIIEKIAENGHAPKSGCSLFGVGYKEAFDRIQDTYIVNRFDRGGSAEKFVIGPYGSGKTHFLRELLEIGEDSGCVTSEVALNKEIDFTQSLSVYKEVVHELRIPGIMEQGIRGLIGAAVENIRSISEGSSQADVVAGWVRGIDRENFKEVSFGRILKRALQAYVDDDDQSLELACRWLGGEVTNRSLARDVDTTVVTKKDENRYGHQSMLSLFQFIKLAMFRGTIVGFDESEQGLSTDRRNIERILSMLQSGINAIADLEGGSALIVYALTPDIVERMDGFPALQQRVADPMVGRGFFEGETLSPKIELTRRTGDQDPVADLKSIGYSLVDLVYEYSKGSINTPVIETYSKIDFMARKIIDNDNRSSNRRTMAKGTCALLVELLKTDKLEIPNLTEETDLLDSEV